MDLARKLELKTMGKAEGAGLADPIGKLIGYHVLVHFMAGRLRHKAGFNDRFLNIFEDLAQEDGFELAAELSDLVLFAQVLAPGQLFEWQFASLYLVR